MAEVTDIEKEFRINVSAPDFDITRGIEVGIQIEERAHRFYSEQARKAGGPLQSFFRFMAEQELQHAGILDSLKKSLAQSGLWARLPQSMVEGPLRSLSAFKKHPGNEHQDNVAEIQALMTAMQNEKKTREFYLRLASAVKSAEGKKFFMDLAEWERKHYEMLSGIYNASSYTRLET
jgi:rubrerythrin